MKGSEFREFFIDELKDIYWAENHLAKALPKMQKAATSPDLAAAFEKHTNETEEHIHMLEQVFEMMGEKAEEKKARQWTGFLKRRILLWTIRKKIHISVMPGLS